jgi:hypothetical protein
MRLIGLLLTLAIVGFLIQRFYGGPTQLSPTAKPAITEPINRATEAVDKLNQLEQEREKRLWVNLRPGPIPVQIKNGSSLLYLLSLLQVSILPIIALSSPTN